MKKATFLIAILIIGLFTITANAQSIVDPGISVYNYKHPNKAAQAKAAGKDQKTVRVANIRTVERFGKYQQGYVSTTPKYAPRPATLVVTREYKPEGVEINPLLSPRNYKTPTISVNKDTAQMADYYTAPDKVYPTRD
ncbi:hypothetical protein GCM10010967_26810 [Dyadobacter beijingensis]|uniref:Uncharacterized protein n=1 Tax=Dyadobacter beijingensis TaxID=365489 RepID=A0ABQ2HUU9_9BACT|nr:hypothetical protein [Dyadobacter beijingensis]GGM92289.1 hypothetical protein GCM10010967_26810 [Dyadobacter beijingensis]